MNEQSPVTSKGVSKAYVDAGDAASLAAADAHTDAAIAALPALAFGTYTPVSNLTGSGLVAVAPSDFQWLRVGNVVTVSGSVQITPATVLADTTATFTLSLPVTDAVFTDITQAAGSLIGNDGTDAVFTVGKGLALVGDVLIEIKCLITPLSNGRPDCAFHFTYQVIP